MAPSAHALGDPCNGELDGWQPQVYEVESVTLALSAILAHKLRSFLTLLGIIFGVATVIVGGLVTSTVLTLLLLPILYLKFHEDPHDEIPA